MIAKWLGLIEAGRIAASGGGSIPLGDATVWNSITNWTDFGTIPGPLRVGDLVLVTDLLPGFGIAQYNGSDWELRQALFPTKADLEAFPELVGTGAIANVGTGVETDPIYYSDGTTWFRTPDGTRYIYPNEPDWASLPTEDTILNNDEVGVDDLGTPHSSGTAQRHGGNEWRLIEGKFASVSDMVAFDTANPVHTDAIGLVKSGGGHDEEAIAYSYQGGNWLRFGTTTTQGYAWTLSSLNDFSAVGLQDGDFGVLTQSGGDPVLVRYKAACPTAYASPIPAWISPEAYNATPVIQGYLIGSEDASTRAAQGWTDILSAAGTRSITGDEGGSGETRLLGEFSGGQLGLAQLACGVSTMLAGTKVWWSAVIRGSTTGSASEADVRFAGDGTNFNWLQQRATGGTLRMTDGSNTVIDSNQIPGGTGSAWPGVASTPDLFVGLDTGSTGVSRVTRKGSAYSAARRPAAASVQNNALRFSAQGTASPSQGVLRISHVIVVTY